MTRMRSILALFAMLLAGCNDPANPVDEPTEVDLLVDALRSMSDPYHDFDAALAAGFEQASPCIPNMGFHYAMPDIVDGVVVDNQPEIMLYEPQPGGAMQLVGVEFLVVAPEWDAANASPPAVAGQTFDDHRAPEAMHGLPFPHYELHVWVWEDNADGIFEPFNPAVSCG
jgi:hypothetical protein